MIDDNIDKKYQIEMNRMMNTREEAIKTIVDAAEKISGDYVALGRLLVAAKEKWGDDIIKDLPTRWSRQFYSRCEAAAMGLMDPRLVGLSGSQYRRLEAYCSKDEQAKVLDKGVEFLVGNGSHLTVRFENLLPEQTVQVIGPDGIRDLNEQRMWKEAEVAKREVELRKKREEVLSAVPKWEIEKGELVIHASETRLTKRELLAILADML